MNGDYRDQRYVDSDSYRYRDMYSNHNARRVLTTKRKRPGVAVAKIALLPAVAVFLFALNQLSSGLGDAQVQSQQPTAGGYIDAIMSISGESVAYSTQTEAPTSTPSYIETIAAEHIAVAQLQRTIESARATDDRDATLAWQDYSVGATNAAATPLAAATATSQALDAIERANSIAVDAIRLRNAVDAEAWRLAIINVAAPALCVIAFVAVALAFSARFGVSLFRFVDNERDHEQEIETQSQPSVIEVHSNNNHTVVVSKMSTIVQKVLPLFAQYALTECDEESNPLTDAEWAGSEKRGVTKPEWYAFRGWMLQNNFARWKNDSAHAQGAELTEIGWRMLEQYKTPSPSDSVISIGDD